MPRLRAFLSEEHGATAAEQALLLVILGVGVVAGALTLKDAIYTTMANASTCMGTGAAAAACDAGTPTVAGRPGS